MAVNNYNIVQSFKAGVDLSAKQNYLVKFDATSKGVIICEAGELPLGMNIENAELNQTTGVVCTSGEKVAAVAGAAVTAADQLASDATGRVVTATVGDFVVGVALEAAAAADDLISIIYTPNAKVTA